VEKYVRAGQVTDENTAHAHCMLDAYGYRHTLRRCNTYCFSNATVVARMCLSVTLYVHYLVCCRGIVRQVCPFHKLRITETKHDGGIDTRIIYSIPRPLEICVLRAV